MLDTITWERSATYHIDGHAVVRSFIKNHVLNFTIPYLHNGGRRSTSRISSSASTNPASVTSSLNSRARTGRCWPR